MIFMVILVTAACGAPTTEALPTSIPACSNEGLTMSTFLAITPEQTSQLEIEGLLGEADGIEEPLLGEWIWVYLCAESVDTRFRITFNTSNRPFKVSKLNIYNPKLDVADLINQFDLPELVYKEGTENQTEKAAKYTFAYPNKGIFASTISDSEPAHFNEVIEIYKESPQNMEQFLAELAERTDIEIIEWQFSGPN